MNFRHEDDHGYVELRGGRLRVGGFYCALYVGALLAFTALGVELAQWAESNRRHYLAALGVLSAACCFGELVCLRRPNQDHRE